MAASVLTALSLGLGGCREAGLSLSGDFPRAEFGDICGHSGPYLLHALAPGEVLARWTESRGGFVIEVQVLGKTPEDGGKPEILSQALWWMGPCGEDPRSFATDVQLERGLSPRSANFIIVSGEGGLVALDPLAERLPLPVLAPGALKEIRSRTVWFLTAQPGTEHHTLSRLTIRSDWDPWSQPAEVSVVAGDIVIDEGTARSDGWPWFGRLNLSRTDGVIEYVDAQDRLVRVPEEGDSEVLLDDVWGFETSQDDLVLWQRRSTTDIEGEPPLGSLHLTDLSSGDTRDLGDGAIGSGLASIQTTWVGSGVGSRWLVSNGGSQAPGPIGLENLATGLAVDIANDQEPLWPVDDRHWILWPSEGPDVETIDLVTGERTPLFPTSTLTAGLLDSGIVYVDGGGLCGGCGGVSLPGVLYHVDPLTAERELLAPRCGHAWSWFASGNVLSLLYFAGNQGGELTLYERAKKRESIIDTSVVSWGVVDHTAFSHPLLAYWVSDPQRPGLWIANLRALSETPSTASAEAGMEHDTDAADPFDQPWRARTPAGSNAVRGWASRARDRSVSP